MKNELPPGTARPEGMDRNDPNANPNWPRLLGPSATVCIMSGGLTPNWLLSLRQQSGQIQRIPTRHFVWQHADAPSLRDSAAHPTH